MESEAGEEGGAGRVGEEGRKGASVFFRGEHRDVGIGGGTSGRGIAGVEARVGAEAARRTHTCNPARMGPASSSWGWTSSGGRGVA